MFGIEFRTKRGDMDLQSLRKLAENTPYYGHLGLRIVEAGHGTATLSLEFKNHLTHPFGFYRGGAIASLADSTGINAVFSLLEDHEKAVTLEMKINFCQAAKAGMVRGEGRVVHRGRRYAVADVEIKGEDGGLVAKAIVTCAIS
jgi:uncharacterized protein (TIGR00369 family)